jgi:hypothetical protein
LAPTAAHYSRYLTLPATIMAQLLLTPFPILRGEYTRSFTAKVIDIYHVQWLNILCAAYCSVLVVGDCFWDRENIGVPFLIKEIGLYHNSETLLLESMLKGLYGMKDLG